MIGASTGSFGGVWAQAELRKVLRTAGARVVEAELAVPRAHVRLAEDGRLLDDELRELAQPLVDALLAEVRPGELVARPRRPTASAGRAPAGARSPPRWPRRRGCLERTA